jgi:hypothetical protein
VHRPIKQAGCASIHCSGTGWWQWQAAGVYSELVAATPPCCAGRCGKMRRIASTDVTIVALIERAWRHVLRGAAMHAAAEEL